MIYALNLEKKSYIPFRTDLFEPKATSAGVVLRKLYFVNERLKDKIDIGMV